MAIEKEPFITKDQAVYAIIGNCDKKKNLSDKQKEDFARYLVNECAARRQIAEQLIEERKICTDLQESILSSALKSIRKLNKAIQGSLLEADTEILYQERYKKYYCDSFLIGMEDTKPPNFSLSDVIAYLEIMQMLTGHMNARKKDGRKRAIQDRTFIGDSLAQWIANAYYKFFGSEPYSKGYGIHSPYERICDDISDYLALEERISRSSMKKAASSF